MDYQNKFIEEARELITGLELQLFGLESNPGDKVAIDEVFRVVHTLKGSASMFGFNSIEQLTHHLETIYDLIRDNELDLTSEIIDITFATGDIIKTILTKNNKLDDEEQAEYNDILDKIYKLSGEDKTEEKAEIENETHDLKKEWKGFYILYKPDEDIYFRGIRPFGIFYELNEVGKYKAIPYLDKVPGPKDFNPNKFYVYWDIFLLTNHPVNEIQDIFIFYREEEYYMYEFDLKHIGEKEFLTEYAKITGRKFNKGEVVKIFKNLDAREDIAIEKPKYIDQKDEKVVKETVLKDIERKTNDLFHKTSTIRVSADKLDHLITNVSEFVTLYAQISLYVKSTESKELVKAIRSLGKLSKRLRDNALEIRLVSINELTVKLQRLIRDLSKKLDKKIDFITEGTETELDKTIIDNLEEPLMHIIRNCIDHGIEDKETRLSMNKPVTGIIRLTAFYSGANVFIQIQDDGRGIDLGVIRQKAIDKGLITSQSQMTSHELYDLLFLPGFSTVDTVSKISGRGVGMDVVKQKINELRGEIEIDSEVNLGTSVTVRLPLTLSIIDTLKVKVGELLYLLPLTAVETCVSIKYKELMNKRKKQYEYLDNILPVIILRDEFSISNHMPDDGRIVVIRHYDKKYCMLVDQVLGDHQAVVKPIGDLHKKHDYFSGASIMGDGSLALILDTGKIYTIHKEIHNLK